MWGSLRVAALAFVLLAAPGPATAAKEPPAAKITPLVVLSGTDGHVREREYHCVRDAKAWAALWRRNRGVGAGHWQSREYDRWVVGVPSLDFGKSMVIAVFKGAGGLTGIHGDRITLEKDVLRFRFRAGWQRDPVLPQPVPESPTGKSAPPPALAVEPPDDPVPFDFFVLPRTELPVVIEEKLKDDKTGDDRYVERARFK